MTKLPEELNLHNIIDYDTQFEKSFIEPLKFITDIIRWIGLMVVMEHKNNTRGVFLMSGKGDKRRPMQTFHKKNLIKDKSYFFKNKVN